MTPPKPMLATPGPDLSLLHNWPYMLQHKVDGIRCLVQDGTCWSRSGKRLPNNYLQQFAQEERWPDGLDGELVSYGTFQDTVSIVMSRDHIISPRELRYVIFDIHNRGKEATEDSKEPYFLADRHQEWLFKQELRPLIPISWVEEREVYDIDDINHHISSSQWQEKSPEGFILRKIYAPYKHGRSTVKQEYLLKYKNFHTDEAEILECIPLYKNTNTAVQDVFGYTTRSSHKENRIQLEKLGAFKCRRISSKDEVTPEDETFNVGTGFSDDQRILYWSQRDQLIGQIISFQYLSVGAKYVPRHPSFRGFRDQSIDGD